MKGRHIAAVGMTAALAVGGTTVAVGQGNGGTLGPKAVGSETFQARFTERSFGVHCANTNDRRRCEQDENPRLAGVSAGNGAVYQDNRRVGRVHVANIVTMRGRENSGGELFLATVVLRDGTLTLQGASAGDEDSPSIPSSITGGRAPTPAHGATRSMRPIRAARKRSSAST